MRRRGQPERSEVEEDIDLIRNIPHADVRQIVILRRRESISAERRVAVNQAPPRSIDADERRRRRSAAERLIVPIPEPQTSRLLAASTDTIEADRPPVGCVIVSPAT